jgi:hypothetical protein
MFIMPDRKHCYTYAVELNVNLRILFNPIKGKATTRSSYMGLKNKIGLTVELGSYGMNANDIDLGINIISEILDNIKNTQVKTKQLILVVTYHKDNMQNICCI